MNKAAGKYVSKRRNGFTLIEAAITITILGLMLAAFTTLLQQSEKQLRPEQTQQRMEKIVKALSTYVETAGRLPCPANPAATDATFGWEFGITPAMIQSDNSAAYGVPAPVPPVGFCGGQNADGTANTVGILPFETLNLPPEVAKDGWGRYFTYAVSAVFTLDNDANDPDYKDDATGNPFEADDDNDFVHARCRDGIWIDLGDNINSVKARFCCAARYGNGGYYPPDTDIRVVFHPDGTTISPFPGGNPVRPNNPTTPASNYGALGDLNTYTDPPFSSDNYRERAVETDEQFSIPAFVLVSHGEDGRGSFLANGTTNLHDADPAYTLQAENYFDTTPPDNKVYNDGPRSFSATPANYFDDFVFWMTQDGIMAANGTSSCRYP